MFANALKSFTSNINSNYILSPQPTATAGPWKIHDAKKKSTGQPVSVFIFDRKSLEPPGASMRSSFNNSTSSLKAVQDEVVERLKREASSLARLRHPSILELAEPVEETRSGGLQFVTEQVTGPLGGVLKDKDANERAGSRRGARSPSQDGRRGQEVDIDELDIQKGLLQVAKGLEFLHESAGLTHCNLTPDAIFINAKGDWKLSGLGFSTAHGNADSRATTSVQGLVTHDPRLPPSVQLSYNYSSPDLIMDSTLSPSTDMFSLGLLIVALYNSPHESPLETHNSASTYKRLLSSSGTTPNPGNSFLSSRPLPRQMPELLSQLLTRRPATRMNARDFQNHPYFDNILVSTLRFLESLPAKTMNEKSAFMRGLPKVLNQFPKSVLEKKVLPMMVEELKDKELVPLLLPNIFLIVENTPGGSRLFSERVLKRLTSLYFPNGHPENPPKSPTPTPTGTAAKKGQTALSSALESGLVAILDYLHTIISKTTAKEFKEDIMPLIHLALESQTHSLQDRALRSLEIALPALDFTTVKNELFPVVANVFAKTSSLGIKIRGLEAFRVLCGGSGWDMQDGLNGNANKAKSNAVVVLDKYTVQEKMVPLLKGIKTKEPGVMMAALDVFKEIGRMCDREVVAMDILPILWNMSFGPLLNLEQFQSFMSTIKSLSLRIEQEQTQKLRELHASSGSTGNSDDFLSFGGLPGARSGTPAGEIDFEKLVLGKQDTSNVSVSNDWGWSTPTPSVVASGSRATPPVQTQKVQAEKPRFEWSTPSPTTQSTNSSLGMGSLNSMPAMKPMTATSNPKSNSISAFAPLQPANTSSNSSSMGMMALQPSKPSVPSRNSASSLGGAGFGSMNAMRPQSSTSTSSTQMGSSGGIDWSSAAQKTQRTASFTPAAQTTTSIWDTPPLQPTQPTMSTNSSNLFSTFNAPTTTPNIANSHPTILYGQTRLQSPPVANNSGLNAFKLAPPPPGGTLGSMNSLNNQQSKTNKTGLDAWESLL